MLATIIICIISAMVAASLSVIIMACVALAANTDRRDF
jgi:hypothetical protein